MRYWIKALKKNALKISAVDALPFIYVITMILSAIGLLTEKYMFIIPIVIFIAIFFISLIYSLLVKPAKDFIKKCKIDVSALKEEDEKKLKCWCCSNTNVYKGKKCLNCGEIV